MKFSIKDFFSKCDQVRSFLWIWSDLLKKSLMENFILCAVVIAAPSNVVIATTSNEIFSSTKIVNIIEFWR